MNIFDKISKTISHIFTTRDKENTKLSAEQIESLARLQVDNLDSAISTLSVFSQSDMNALYKKYLVNSRSNINYKEVSYIIPSFTKKYKGKALVAETTMVFGGLLEACKIMKKINEEILKNFENYIPDEGLQIYQTKVSTIMLLGIIMQTKFLSDYTNYLWTHFTKVVVNRDTQILPYQVKYLTLNYEKFINLINYVCNNDSPYTFVKSLKDLSAKHADAFIYQDGKVFLNYADKRAYSNLDDDRLVEGLVGFNLVSHALTWLDIFLHNEYLKRKALKEKYENTVAQMKYELMDVDKDSTEYKILEKRIKQYEDKIALYDKKIKEYEEEDLV